MILSILFWIIFGAISGWIASNITGEGARINGWMNVAVGVVGAIIGGLIFNALGGAGVTGFNLYSLVVAVIGAIILLWIVRMAQSTSRA